ncbi:MAG: thioredoxin family protein [Rhodospirillaceae bacterium]|nr:thioredoxin family protein [Rhodospirillaceae bacterium]
MKRFYVLAYIFAFIAPMPINASAAELLYFYSDACNYCERWNNEVGSIYNKTKESSVLKLRPVDIHAEIPGDIEHIKGVVYTPTFVAVDNGREIGRIVGYGGDIFFWQHIEVLLNDMKKSKSNIIPPCPDNGNSDKLLSC